MAEVTYRVSKAKLPETLQLPPGVLGTLGLRGGLSAPRAIENPKYTGTCGRQGQ